MADKVFITCAVTGSAPLPKHPNFPFRPDHVAQEALDAAAAGASIIHLHVRDPQTGAPSQSLEDYREVVGLIRAKNSELILNVTTGPGCTWIQSEEDPALPGPGTLMFTAERRLEHILDLKPDMCTLDICTMNLWGGAAINLKPMVTRLGHMIQDAGVLPEIECFEAGDFVYADDLIAEGALPAKVPYTFVLGTKYGLPATTEAMQYSKNQLPRGAIFTGFGIQNIPSPWRRNRCCWAAMCAWALRIRPICGAGAKRRIMPKWWSGRATSSTGWARMWPALARPVRCSA